MLRIEGILWNEESELHIWNRHRVAPEEVEAAAYAAGLVVKGRGKDVYDMSAAERRRYKRYVYH